MKKAIKLADFLTKCVDEESSKFSSDDPFFIQAADELRRLAAIEQAATALIKCKDCQGADIAAQGLADALGIELPQIERASVQQAPVSLGALLHAFSFICKNYTPNDFPQPLQQSVLAAVLLEALWPHLSDDGRKSHSAVVDAMSADQSKSSHAIEANNEPHPSAIELQDAEVGIPEPVTELINPAATEPSARDQALAQLVKGVKVWPETCRSYIAPMGWDWVKPTGHEVSLCKIGEVGIFKEDWQAAHFIPYKGN